MPTSTFILGIMAASRASVQARFRTSGHSSGRIEYKRRVPDDPVGGGQVGAQDSLEPPAEALDGRAGAQVALVGLQDQAVHAPGIEGVDHEQQAGSRVDGRALRRGLEPGVTDLGDVGRLARVGAPRLARDMDRTGRPAPPFEAHEADRSDDRARAPGRTTAKGEGAARVRVGDRALDVIDHLGAVARHGRELERAAVAGRGARPAGRRGRA